MRRTNQFERTDRDITNAVLSLMERKPFEKITVQDILDEALINRSTFYLHFPDKYAVLERLQDRYIAELSNLMDLTAHNKDWNLDKINSVFAEFFSSHRKGMKQMLSVRTEHLNMEEQMCQLLSSNLRKMNGDLSEIELKMFSMMTVTFLIDSLDHRAEAGGMATGMLKTWLDMTLYFFQVDRTEENRQRLLEQIGKLRNS